MLYQIGDTYWSSKERLNHLFSRLWNYTKKERNENINSNDTKSSSAIKIKQNIDHDILISIIILRFQMIFVYGRRGPSEILVSDFDWQGEIFFNLFQRSDQKLETDKYF